MNLLTRKLFVEVSLNIEIDFRGQPVGSTRTKPLVQHIILSRVGSEALVLGPNFMGARGPLVPVGYTNPD